MSQAVMPSILAAITAAGLCLGPAFGDTRLVPGFDAERPRTKIGHADTAVSCPPAPPPIVEMGGTVSRYDPKDPSQSHVDPVRDAAAKAQEAGLTTFAKQVDRLSDRAIVANPVNPALNRCIMAQLAAWARAGALQGDVEANDRVGRDQAVMEQAWYGAAFASAVTKLGGFDAVPGSDSQAVQAWFRALAQSVMETHSVGLDAPQTVNNHRYWAGYGVAAIGVLLHDRGMVAFGRAVLREGLAAVAADGSLPAEMARGAKALSYQYFATLPLAGLVTVADRNGMALTKTEEGALDRLIAFDLDAAAHPEKVAAISHAAQEQAVTAFALGWIDMLLDHVSRRNSGLAGAMEAIASRPGMRPAWFIFLGGDVTATYNPGATIVKAP